MAKSIGIRVRTLILFMVLKYSRGMPVSQPPKGPKRVKGG